MTAKTGADLLLLQGHIKRDPEGYADEFDLQWRHYRALLALFRLRPAHAAAAEFGELVGFVAQVADRYPAATAGFAPEVLGLLAEHGAALDPALRTALVRAAILLRNRGRLPPAQLLPALFELFKLPDKALRALVFRHIVADLKAANRRSKAERLNRRVQGFLRGVLAGEHEGAARRATAVLADMWRRGVWRDAPTANALAEAATHRSPRVMAAALKFFLGQDAAEGDGGSDSDDDGGGGGGGKGGRRGDAPTHAARPPSKEELYAAMHKGTAASKKKKQRKLARVQASVKKAQRRGEGGAPAAGSGGESFAALQLLNDPQGWAEALFARLRAGRERWEARLALMAVVSRAVGVHKLLLLNFYPFLQRYVAPSQRDVTHVLAALVQACHEQVPPEVLAPVLRQLVDAFVHDRARPEAAATGLAAVREVCARAPLVMTPDLLSDLVGYRRFKDKAVAAAARSLVGLFRELAPAMLAKKDRGRGADLGAAPAAYGAAPPAAGVDGAELLAAARAAGRLGAGGEVLSSSEGDESGSEEGLDSGSEDEEEEEEEEEDEEEEEEEEEEGVGAADGSSSGEESGSLGSGSDDDEGGSSSEGGSEGGSGSESDGAPPEPQPPPPKRVQPPQAGSLSQLKRQLAAAAGGGAGAAGAGAAEGAGAAAGAGVPEDWGRILTQEDHEAIRELKRRRLIEGALAKHGLRPAGARAARAREAAEADADAALALRARLGTAHERRVDPASLVGRHRRRADKAERLASVLEGREGRPEFGAKSALKKNKTGGLSNREKARRKSMPKGARERQVRARMGAKTRGASRTAAKQFRGRVKKR